MPNEDKLISALDFVKSTLARRIMSYASALDYAPAIDKIKVCLDEQGRAKVDLSSLEEFPTILSPGTALRLGVMLMLSAVDAIDANALRLLASLHEGDKHESI